MGKKRLLDSKIRKSQSFAELTYRQRDLWQGIITMADDQGRLPGAPAFIRSIVWPYDDITLKEVSEDLHAISDSGYITIYEADGGRYIQIVKWWCYQNLQWASPSDHPAPPGWVDRCRYHTTGNKIATEQWDSNGGYMQLPSELPSVQGSGIESVNVNDNGDVDDETPEGAELPEFAIEKGKRHLLLEKAFTKATTIKKSNGSDAVDKRWFASIQPWVEKEVTPQMIAEAVALAAGKYTISGPWSLDTIMANLIIKREQSHAALEGYTPA